MSQFGLPCRRSVPIPTRILIAGLAGCLLAGATSWMTAGPPPDPPAASEFASVPALMSQVEYYMSAKRLEDSLTDPASYNESTQTKVAKDGASLVALLMTLGLHDQDSPLKASAPRLVELAEELVTAAADYAQAKAAFEALQKGIANGAEGGQALSWKKRCDLVLLMKQVTTVHTILKRTIRSKSRLAKRKEDAAGKAALLAVIGQATLIDTEAAKAAAEKVIDDKGQIEEKLAEWYRYSIMMRDSSGGIIRGIAADDFEAVTKNEDLLQHSCDGCHEVFDIDE